jgi:hypothetical protein
MKQQAISLVMNKKSSVIQLKNSLIPWILKSPFLCIRNRTPDSEDGTNVTKEKGFSLFGLTSALE